MIRAMHFFEAGGGQARNPSGWRIAPTGIVAEHVSELTSPAGQALPKRGFYIFSNSGIIYLTM